MYLHNLNRQYLPVREAELVKAGKEKETDPEKGSGPREAARNAAINGFTDGSDQLDGQTHAARVAHRQIMPVGQAIFAG